MTRVLFEEFSPACNVKALVEEYDYCAYFYLWNYPGEEYSSMRSCWIRNYKKAPELLDVAAMHEGSAPMLPADCCAHPEGASRLEPQLLSIVWFEEGDAAALLYDEEILCIIPGWTGRTGNGHDYPGYARDCIKECPLCLPLGTPSTNALIARVDRSRQFWQSWKSDRWPEIQKTYLDTITQEIGPIDKYYAIDGGNWPPKAMVKIPKGDVTYVVTLGLSILPQPVVEQYTENPDQLRRFELGFAIETEWLEKNEKPLLQYISGQSNLPWSNITFLAKGHTIPCKEISDVNKCFEYVLLTQPQNAPSPKLPVMEGDPVNLLWVVPITTKEQKYAVQYGSSNLVAHKKENDYWIFNGRPRFIQDRTEAV